MHRQSCEKEWAMSHPKFAVSKWIGHSITVSCRHSANAVPDELYAEAAGGLPDQAAVGAQRNAQQKASETGGKRRKRQSAARRAGGPRSGNDNDFARIPVSRCQQSRWSRGDSNPRAETVSRPRLHV
jgi:hypothetical protein